MSVKDINPIADFGSSTTPISATQTTFNFTFPIVSTADIEIRFDGEVKANSGDFAYRVTRDDMKGGQVIFTKPPKVADPTLVTLQVRRATPFTRETEYQDNGDLLAQTINDDFDRLWLCLQEERAAADASLSRVAGTKVWEAQAMKIVHVADGTADDDAATVGQTRRLTNNAQQSATAAAGSATAAANSKTGADTAKAGAVAAQTAAEAARDAAKDWNTKAEAAAGKAATDAATSANAQMKPSLDAAAASATAAAGSASAAAASAAKAANDAQTAATAQIQPLVTAANTAKTAAQTAATTAANDAKTAATALIQPLVTAATNAKTAAETAATNAGTQATNAALSATNSEKSATASKGYRDNAATSAQAAAQSAQAAAASAKAAEDTKASVITAATDAATTAATAAAAGSATAASGSASVATNQAVAAAASATAANGSKLSAEAAYQQSLQTLADAPKKSNNLSDLPDKNAALKNLGIDAVRDATSQNIYAPNGGGSGRGMRLTMTTNAGVNSWGFYGSNNNPVPLDATMFPSYGAFRAVLSPAQIPAGQQTNGGQILVALNDGTSTGDVASASLRVVKIKGNDGSHIARALLSVSDFDTPGTGEKNAIFSFEQTGNFSMIGGLRTQGVTVVGGPSTGEIVTLQPDTTTKNCFIRFRDSKGGLMSWVGNDKPDEPGKFTISSTAGGSRIDLNGNGDIYYGAKAGMSHRFNGSIRANGNVYAGDTTFTPIAYDKNHTDNGYPGQFRSVEPVHANYLLAYPDGNSAPGLYIKKRNTTNGSYAGTITCDDNGNWSTVGTFTVTGTSNFKGGITASAGLTSASGLTVTHGNLTVSAGAINVTGTISASGTVSAAGKVLTSDINLKENIGEAKAGASERIAAVKLHSYDWKDGRLPHRDVGVIAQELEAIDPMYVSDIDGVLHYDPDVLMLDMLATIQELQKEVAALKAAK